MGLSSLEDIARIAADKIEIQEVISGVTLFSDRGDFEKARNFYTDDATLDYSSMFGEESANLEIGPFWQGVIDFLPGFQATHHLVSNYTIEVDGDTAIAHSMVRALHLVNGKTSENGGYYRHQMVRTKDGWRIKHQVYDIMFTKDDVFGLIEEARSLASQAVQRSN